MPLPYFFEKELNTEGTFILSEETSKHAIQVLRMKEGERLKVTDGKGHIQTGEIIQEHKKATHVRIIERFYDSPPVNQITIAISPVKNTARFEWFLEKATEIGVSVVIPLLCERTEKQYFKQERMTAILVSAMLQSQQAWLPLLEAPLQFNTLINLPKTQQRYIAHCAEAEKKEFSHLSSSPGQHQLILIGPEGDFTKEEIDKALLNGFLPVSLGKTRLRTETAGLVACILMNSR